MNKFFILVLLITISTIPTLGENMLKDTCRMHYSVESSTNIGIGGISPLWLNANKNGLGSCDKNIRYLEVGVSKNGIIKNIAYKYGIEFVGAHNLSSNFFIQQAYVDLCYRNVQVSLGSKERMSEFVDPQLSSGGLAFSANARPIPQICVEIPDYVTIPYTNNWLAMRGYIAYGVFTDGVWQKSFVGGLGNRTSGVLFHSKVGYIKIADPNNTSWQFECGLEMYDQFGGTRYYSNGTKEKMRSGLNDYFKALIPMHGGEKSPAGDQANIEGNMLGCYNLSFKCKFSDWGIRPYYEHYFEDQSMMWGKYPWRDGLIGLEIAFPKNRIIDKIVMEYFGSMDQSGPLFVTGKDGKESLRIAGGDDYYNNGIYLSWSHYGMAIGNPLFMSPIYNKDGSLMFQSTRMTARHIGISGEPTSEWSYRVLMSYTRNWGRYNHLFTTTHGSYPSVKTDTSTLYELTFSPHKLPGWSFVGSAATDRGDMLGNNTGVMLTVRVKQ